MNPQVKEVPKALKARRVRYRLSIECEDGNGKRVLEEMDKLQAILADSVGEYDQFWRVSFSKYDVKEH